MKRKKIVNQLISKTEAMLQRSHEEAKELLPLLLDQIFDYGIVRMSERAPVLLSMIIETMIQIDAAKFMNELPGVPAKFMIILWDGIRMLAEKSEEMKVTLDKNRDIKVNLEAFDSPLEGHFIISKGRISGGAGLLPYAQQDFRFFGSTQVLLQLLYGDLELGFNNPKLQTEGHPGFLPILTPIMEAISTLINASHQN